MESPPPLKKQIPCTDLAFSPSLASQVRGLEIYARWDGIQEHPATVSILFTIQAQPSTHLQLLKTDDPLLVSHAVCSVESDSTQVHDIIPNRDAAEPKKLQGDTLTAVEAEDYIHAIGHETSLEEDGIDTSPLRTLSSSALNRQVTPTTLKDGTPLNVLGTLSNGCPRRGPSFSDQDTPLVLVWDENGAPPTPNRGPLHPPRQKSTSESSPTQRPGRFKVRSGRARLRASAIGPDQLPRQRSTKERQVSVTSPRESKLRQSSAGGNSSRSPRLSRIPTDGSGCTRTSKEASIVGSTRCYPRASRYYGTLPWSRVSRPAPKRSASTGSLDSSSSATTVVKHSQNNGLSLASDVCAGDQKDDTPWTCCMPHQESLEAALSFPIESYAVWVNGVCYAKDSLTIVPTIYAPDRDTSQCRSPILKDIQSFHDTRFNTKLPEPPLNLDVAATKHPTTVATSDSLHVYFPIAMRPDTYRVLLDLEVLLSVADNLGWQTFKIPGLPIEPDSDVRGFLHFQLTSLSDNPAPIPPVQFDSRRFSIIQDVQESHIESDFPLSEPLSLPVRLQTELKHIRQYNTNVAIYSSFTYQAGQGMCMKNYASLSIETTWDDDTFARRTSFSVFVRNGPPSGGIYKLKSGQCSVKLTPYQNTVTDFNRTVKIWIERDHQDMVKPLRLEFTCFYPSMYETSILLPVVFPSSGKVLSEKIWIFKPLPPLILHPVVRPFLSTWTVSEQLIGSKEMLCFLRMQMPPRYPNALSDDAVVRLRSHNPVSFVGLEVPDDVETFEKCSNTIPSLNYIVDIVPRNQLECRMMFDLEIGSEQCLLRVEALEWVPKFSMINGRISSAEHPCWWEEDDQLWLLKAPWMIAGDILHIELAFIMIGRLDDAAIRRNQFIKIMGTLPRITDKVVFGGDLACNIDDAVITLFFNQDRVDNEDLPFSMLYGENTKRLPLLRRGHRLELMFKLPNPMWRKPSKKLKSSMRAKKVGFSEGVPLRPRTVRFEDKMLDTFSSSSDDCEDDSDAGRCDGNNRIRMSDLHTVAMEEKKINTAAGKKETEVDAEIYTQNDEPDTDIGGVNADIFIAGKELRQYWRQQLCGSDASSTSSDEDSFGPIELYDNDDDDDIDDDFGMPGLADYLGMFMHGIGNALLILILLTEVIDNVYHWLNRRSPLRFVMRYLALFLVCMTVRQYPGLLSGMSPAVFSNGTEAASGTVTPPVVVMSEKVEEEEEEEKGVVWTEDTKVYEARGLRDSIDMLLGWRPING
ncbi:MAG: hypothetical protein Q9169_003378 [Polycauliona sp. 2 TL-2023]